MAKRALIVWGGWDGHSPQACADLFAEVLRAEGFGVDVRDSLDALADAASYDLLVPHWTMGSLSPELTTAVVAAVSEQGVGLAGCHGGLCDAFRDNTDWQFMTGGQFVAHPGNIVSYRVHLMQGASPIIEGFADFDVKTEQYYLHVDPANRVLATTSFPIVDGPHAANGSVEMPVCWTRRFGKGRVFYHSLGHDVATLRAEPTLTLTRRGFTWAAKGWA